MILAMKEKERERKRMREKRKRMRKKRKRMREKEREGGREREREADVCVSYPNVSVHHSVMLRRCHTYQLRHSMSSCLFFFLTGYKVLQLLPGTNSPALFLGFKFVARFASSGEVHFQFWPHSFHFPWTTLLSTLPS